MIFSAWKCPTSLSSHNQYHYGNNSHLDKLPSSNHWRLSSHTPHSWALQSPAPRWRVSSGWRPIMPILLCSFYPGPEPNWRGDQWMMLWFNLRVKNIVSIGLLAQCRSKGEIWEVDGLGHGQGEQGENRSQKLSLQLAWACFNNN